MGNFRIILTTTFLFFLITNWAIAAQEEPVLSFFYSETCLHCAAEQKFLNDIEKKYPELSVFRYPIHETKNVKLLEKIAKERGSERYIGVVPLTFVGKDFFVGFDNPEGIGRKIEDSIIRLLKNQPTNKQTDPNLIHFPILGDIDPSKYSLPVLAIILGFLDGFNVCSLGALVLILGLVLLLKSRKKILLFGGVFILTTAFIYGLLIILWFKLFSFFSSYIKFMEVLIGLLGIGGSFYFFKEFYRFKKHGPTCEITENSNFIDKITKKIKTSFKNPKSIWALVFGVLLFAVVLTIVEFPCSAAIPVVFAGILSNAHLPGFTYILYIALFILLYMLDELVVFLIAAFTMRLWLTSPKFTAWITFIEAVILAVLGFYYLFGGF